MCWCGTPAVAGGGAEPMPGTNYTDMPPYHPYYADAPSYRPLPTCRTRRSCAYLVVPSAALRSLTLLDLAGRRAAMARPPVPFQKL